VVKINQQRERHLFWWGFSGTLRNEFKENGQVSTLAKVKYATGNKRKNGAVSWT
jgi:hypothetical protein